MDEYDIREYVAPSEYDRNYPMGFAQKFEVIDYKLEELQKEIDEGMSTNAGRYLDVAQNSNTGEVQVSLLNANHEALDTKSITITEKLIKSASIDLEHKLLILTCLDNSTVEASLEDLIGDYVNKIETVDEKVEAEKTRAMQVENTKADKTGPLPCYTGVSPSTAIGDFISNNNIGSDVIIISCVSSINGYYIGRFERHGGTYSFEFEEIGGSTSEMGNRYTGEVSGSTTFGEIFGSSTFLHDFAEKEGPLPRIYADAETVISLLDTYSLTGKPFIFSAHNSGACYLAKFDAAGGNHYFFMIISLDSAKYLEGNYENLTDVRISDLLSRSFSTLEISNNKVTSLSSSSTDVQYPSAKAVYDELQLKSDKIGKLPYFKPNAGYVSDFLLSNNLWNEPFVISMGALKYLCGFSAAGSSTSATSGSFVMQRLDSSIRYSSKGSYISLNDKTWISLVSSSTYRDDLELTRNKVTSLSNSSTDSEYPSAKATYDNLELKLDKTGPLPEFLVRPTDSVLDFIETKGVNGKPLVLHLDVDVPGRYYYYQGCITYSSTRLAFVLKEESSSSRVYAGQITSSNSITFADILSLSYLHIYENQDNKVTSLSASSTDTEYPSAKCVYDQLETKLSIVSVSSETLLKDLPWIGILSISDTPSLADRVYFKKRQELNNRISLIVENSDGYYFKTGTINNLTLAEYFQQADFHEYVTDERTIAGIDLADNITTSELTNALFTVTDIVLDED